MGTIVDKG